MAWNTLTQIEDVQKIQQSSMKNTQIFLKHSPRCSISVIVYSRMKNVCKKYDEIHFYLIDVLTHKNISNAIAQQFDIKHESPQLIILKNGKVHSVFNHTEISPLCIEE